MRTTVVIRARAIVKVSIALLPGTGLLKLDVDVLLRLEMILVMKQS
jgi:hypothetical protein